LQKQFPKKNPFFVLCNGFNYYYFLAAVPKFTPKKPLSLTESAFFFLGIFVCSQSGDHPYEEEEDVDKCGNHPS